MASQPALKRIALVALGIAGVLMVFFAVRLVSHWVYWNDPQHHDLEIADWMTPAYVGHAWSVPRAVIAEAIELPGEFRGRRMPLEDLAEELGMPFEELKTQLEDAIAAHRAGS